MTRGLDVLTCQAGYLRKRTGWFPRIRVHFPRNDDNQEFSCPLFLEGNDDVGKP